MKDQRKQHQNKKLSNKAYFFWNFFKNPLKNASITPSSKSASIAIFEGIDFSKIRTIVELGPGFGEFTKTYIDKIHPDTKVVLFEIDDKYVQYLQNEFGNKVIVEHSSAHLMNEKLSLLGIEKVDLIISGLPFAIEKNIFKEIKKSIKEKTDQGTILRYFTYMPLIMKKYYTDLPNKKQRFVLKNFPPMWIYGIN
jgi:phospholipid N-methyltransferase